LGTWASQSRIQVQTNNVSSVRPAQAIRVPSQRRVPCVGDEPKCAVEWSAGKTQIAAAHPQQAKPEALAPLRASVISSGMAWHGIAGLVGWLAGWLG
jgi:hypothetical protein